MRSAEVFLPSAEYTYITVLSNYRVASPFVAFKSPLSVLQTEEWSSSRDSKEQSQRSKRICYVIGPEMPLNDGVLGTLHSVVELPP